MIKLNPKLLLRIKDKYYKQMVKKIENRYNHENSSKPIIGNPFTCKPYTSLFEDGLTESLNFPLVEDLLTKPFDYIRDRYADLNNYFLTCELVHYSSFQIDKQLERYNINITKKERHEFREKYVSLYMNDWINEVILSHPYYYKNNENFSAFISDVERRLYKLNSAISSIVDYSILDAELRHELLTGIAIEVCPYCNRQYITKYQKDSKERSTADLDHFLPKSVFQLLSLSLFNFVPSCQICNSRFKMAKSVEILYPYHKGFDNEAKFEVKLNPESTIDSIIGNNLKFDLNINVSTTDDWEKIENSINLFHLREIYKNHKDYVRELLYKKHAYANTYKSQLTQLFYDLDLGPTEINLFLYGSNLKPSYFGRRPLSKLAYDIIYHN